jgi:hypothetical protein
MVPSSLLVLDALPLTPNGKVDRAALPEPGPALSAGAEREPPATDLETSLASIWSDVLGVAELGRRDDFFVSGGNSLRATQLNARIQQALGVRTTVRDIFLRPCIADLAEHIEVLQWVALRASAPPDAAAPDHDDLEVGLL